MAIGTVANQIEAYQQQYQALSPFNVNLANPNYVGTLLDQGLGFGTGASMFDPNYQDSAVGPNERSAFSAKSVRA